LPKIHYINYLKYHFCYSVFIRKIAPKLNYYQLAIKMSFLNQNIFLLNEMKYFLHSLSYGRNIL